MVDTEIDIDQFRKMLNVFSPVSQGDWNKIKKLITFKTIKRKEVFHREGKKCKSIGFIFKGCLRSVKANDGEERTFDFAIENEFITDYVGVLSAVPSTISIVAVENSVVGILDADKFFALFDTSTTLQRLGRRIAEYVACYYQQRLISAYYDTPTIRYNKLLRDCPELFLRVPHNILANYLGMRKETLSRLRKKQRDAFVD